MSRIKGKTPTRSQRKVLSTQVENLEDWLYVGIRHADDAGNRNVSRNTSKTQMMVFVNKNTADEIEIQI